MLYDLLFAKVRKEKTPEVRNYRCDSPEYIRNLAMTIIPEDSDGFLRVSHSIIDIKKIPVPFKLNYNLKNTSITRCSICLSLLVNGVWKDIVDVKDNNLGTIDVKYDICPECEARFNPSAREGMPDNPIIAFKSRNRIIT